MVGLLSHNSYKWVDYYFALLCYYLFFEAKGWYAIYNKLTPFVWNPAGYNKCKGPMIQSIGLCKLFSLGKTNLLR